MSDELQNGKIKNLNIYILLCLIFIISLYLFEVIIPFAVAFIIAYLVNPIKVLLDKYLNETVSSLLAVILFIICLLSLLILISPIIIKQTQNLFSILPSYMSKIEILIEQYSNQYSINEKINNTNAATMIDGPEAVLSSNELNKPNITEIIPTKIESITI